MGIIDAIFPKKCLNCGRDGKYICKNCLTKVPKLKTVCPYCEKPSIDGMTHAKCMRIYGLDGLVSIWDYEGVIRKAILALKYKYATEVARELSNTLVFDIHFKRSVFPKKAVVVPVPLHWYRGNLRGFNQAEMIGKVVAKEFGWKFIPDLLIRRKHASSQTSVKTEDRPRNIRRAFFLNPSALNAMYSEVILFDDVFTTGSTLKEAASVLKRGMARSVWGLTIAR